MIKVNWGGYLDELKSINLHRRVGKIKKISGLSIEAIGFSAAIGDICLLKPERQHVKEILAQVVGQTSDTIILMPLGDIHGLSVDCTVEFLNVPLKIAVGDGLLGGVFDPLGQSLNDTMVFKSTEKVALKGDSHNPLSREPISKYLMTGVRAIDAFLPLGMGQRIGIFSGSGVGKSTLLGMIAKNSSADINVVVLIGERGREVNDFIRKILTKETLEKTVMVVATADQPTLIRELAASAGTSIAEYFSTKGKNVLLFMDSVTRFAMARREIGLSIGEPATSRGYTPSTFTELPKLIERAGSFSNKGSITGIYTVLVEGDDLNEPVSDHMRAILDGHIVLSRELANQGHFPAIDILKSISRIANDLWTNRERLIVKSLIKLLDVRDRYQDVVEIGAYKSGSNPELDRALILYPRLYDFLVQTEEKLSSREELFAQLEAILNS